MKIALIIPTFNRSKFLKKCLDSVKNTYMKEGSLIYIIDDGSTDKETIRLIKEFEKPGCVVEKIFKKNNKGPYDSMLTAYDYCFSKYEYVTLIGSDIIVNNYFYDMMTYFYTLFPNNIISGFNTLTISEKGSPRHPVIEDCGFYVKKNTSGSACFGFNKIVYDKFFKKTLEDLMKVNLKCYDTISTKKSSDDGYKVICTVPSVAEHIGIESSMGHNIQPDISIDYRQHIDLLSNEKKLITFNLATYPARIDTLRKVINNLLSINTIDKIRVYLNEYEYVPEFLKNEKIEYVIGKDNLKDSGKFYWAEDYKDEYYFSIDDDILIDEEYIKKHIELLNKNDNNSIVSLHGKVLNEVPVNFKDNKEHYHCLENVDRDRPINFPGTGVMVFDNLKIKFPISMFKYHGMADLWVARYCQLNKIPCIVRQHKKGDITLSYQGSDTLWNLHNNFASQHNEILRSIPKWRVYKPNSYDLSIIISTYKNTQYLNECFNSIIDSIGGNNVEVLVGIDSCMDSYNFVKSNTYPSNFKFYFFEKNNGPYIVFNTLSKISKSENIMFFGSDDIMDKNMVGDIINGLRDYDCVKPVYVNFNDGRSININSKKFIGEGVFGVKKSIFDYMNGFEPWMCAADSDFMGRIYRNKYKIKFTSRINFYRRIHKNGLTSRADTGMSSSLRAQYARLSRNKKDAKPLKTMVTETYSLIKGINYLSEKEQSNNSKNVIDPNYEIMLKLRKESLEKVFNRKNNKKSTVVEKIEKKPMVIDYEKINKLLKNRVIPKPSPKVQNKNDQSQSKNILTNKEIATIMNPNKKNRRNGDPIINVGGKINR